MSDCDQQRLSQLDYRDSFWFFNLERLFWQFCNKLAVLGSAFLQRPHTVLHSSAWQPDFGFIVQSNNLLTRKWPLIFDRILQLEVKHLPLLGYLYLWGYVTRPWWHWWCKLFFIWRGAASFCTRLTFRSSAATSKDCAQQMNLPNVLIVLLHWFLSICMNRLDVDSADAAVSRTVLCSFLPVMKQTKKNMISFSYFLSCEFCVNDPESFREIKMTLRHQCRN